MPVEVGVAFEAIAATEGVAAGVGAAAAGAGAVGAAGDALAAGGLDASLTSAAMGGADGLGGLGGAGGLAADGVVNAMPMAAPMADAAADMGGLSEFGGAPAASSSAASGATSLNPMDWVKQNKDALTLGGQALSGIGQGVNGALNRQTALQIANIQAEAPTNQFLAKRNAISAGVSRSPLPFSPTQAILTRPDGSPVYVSGSGIVQNPIGAS